MQHPPFWVDGLQGVRGLDPGLKSVPTIWAILPALDDAALWHAN